MELDNQVTVIEISADYLYLIVLGERSLINNFIKDIKTQNPTDTTQYIPVKINYPIANKCYELSKTLNNNIDIELLPSLKNVKNVIIDDGIEVAQCYTYAEGYTSELYMLMTLVEENGTYVLGYPKFDLGDEEDPEAVIEEWFKKKVKKISKSIKKNIKYITVVGESTNILVIATQLKNKKT